MLNLAELEKSFITLRPVVPEIFSRSVSQVIKACLLTLHPPMKIKKHCFKFLLHCLLTTFTDSLDNDEHSPH